MFFRILKKDFRRKRSMNIILLIFIILATTFLASSVNNLMAISRSVDYFMDKAKTPDYIISAYDRGENEELDKWINSSKYINSYEADRSIILSKDSVKMKNHEVNKDFEPSGQMLLEAQPKNYGKLLSEKGEEINLKQGEAAFSIVDKTKNDLQIGDKVVITLGNIEKEFTIKEFSKDAIFGSSMMEMKRVLISNEDYNEFKAGKDAGIMINYYIKTSNVEGLEKEFKNVPCNTTINFDQSMLSTTFILDMMPSGVLIIVSLCLILIAFLILRFTIIFTLQDDFKEIGVMKAIGLRNFDIKKVYLIKYLAITIIGAVLGFAASFPFGNVFFSQSQGNILMETSARNVYVNIICSIFIVLIVLLFCYTCTRKLNKFSAIDAIRNGSNGESFKNNRRLKLKSYHKLNVPTFIALNDILCNFKRFIVLILTFCIGTILIIVPLNTINTFKDGNIIKIFGIDYSDVYLETDNMDKYTMANKEGYLKDLEKLTQSFKADGIDMKIYGQAIYRLKFYAEDKENIQPIMSLQYLNNDNNNLEVLEGKMPELENEAALTEIAAKKLNVSIGDTIHVQLGKSEKELIITGLYESMTNMGLSVRLNPKMDIDFKYLAVISPFQGKLGSNNDVQAVMEKLRNKYPSYTFNDSQGYVSRYIGSTIDQVGVMKNLIVLVVICINALITILMMKAFITKEKAQIAMLKSIGFRNSSIRFWQSARISLVLITAIILGIILSSFLGPLTMGQVLSIMGIHNLVFKVKPLEVYVVYPVILLAVTTAIAYVSASAVKKVDLKEINNME